MRRKEEVSRFMLKALAMLIGGLVALITFSMYCCLLAASREDDWLREHPPDSKIKDDGLA